MKKQCRATIWFNCCALLLAVALSACARDTQTNEGAATASDANVASASNAKSTTGGDASKLDAEIAELEKQAEVNPGDNEVQMALSAAYLRRANAFRETQRLKEALRDYQSALRRDPDNEEAQKWIAEISPQIEGQATGEYGEPAPLPISPGVTTGEEGEDTPEPSPTKERARQRP